MRFLHNEVVLVTGSSRGIGAAVALKLAEYGARVIVNYHSNESAANEVVQRIQRSTGTSPLCIRADVSQEEEVKNLMKQIKDQAGKLTAVINNAGISIDGLLPRFSQENMDKIWQTNVRSAFLVCKHAFSVLSRVESGGSIVNMSSVAGMTGNAGQSVYSASKAALIALTKSLAKEFASRNIRVNAVAPGLIETEMTQALPDQTKQKYAEAIALKRFGSGEDVAETCCFLISSRAGYITGQTFVVDGGLTM